MKHLSSSAVLLLCLLFSIFIFNSVLVTAENDQQTVINQQPTVTVTVTDNQALIAEFIPTNEWQTVLPGQSIPPGLWVRMDMTTGIKTARLLPEEERQQGKKQQNNDDSEAVVAVEQTEEGDKVFASQQLQLVPQPEEKEENENGQQHHSPDLTVLDKSNTATQQSQSLSQSEIDSLSTLDPLSPEAAELLLPQPNSKQRVLSAEHMKLLSEARARRLAAMKKYFKGNDDAEVLQQYINIILNPNSAFEFSIQALAGIETVVHQVDNAVNFVTMGGLDVLYDIIEPKTVETTNNNEKNETVPTPVSASEVDPPSSLLLSQRLLHLQKHTVWVLGTATQNNDRVRQSIIETHGIAMLLKLWNQTLIDHDQLHQDIINSNFQHTSEEQTLLKQIPIDRLQLLSKLLYTFSALLRSSSQAQQVFYEQGGLAVLNSVLNTHWLLPLSHNSDIIKQQLIVFTKGLSLLHDIAVDATINVHAVNGTHATYQPLFEAISTNTMLLQYLSFLVNLRTQFHGLQTDQHLNLQTLLTDLLHDTLQPSSRRPHDIYQHSTFHMKFTNLMSEYSSALQELRQVFSASPEHRDQIQNHPMIQNFEKLERIQKMLNETPRHHKPIEHTEL